MMMHSDHVLVAVCGLPGVGKSTVSSYVTDLVGGVRLRTDAIRKELVEEPTYSETERERVYDTLFTRAQQQLADGSVVLDATFAETSHREAARRLAEQNGVEFRLIHVVCSQGIAERRIATREGISDADVSVHREFKDEFDRIDIDHAEVDNSGTLEETREEVETLFRAVPEERQH